MRCYIGEDIADVKRIREELNSNSGFKESTFTKNEIIQLDSSCIERGYQQYAARFAAKEAFYKAVSKLLADNGLTLDELDIEIVNNETLYGRPEVRILNKKLLKFFIKQSLHTDLSMSHLEEYAVAGVIVYAN